MQHVSVCCILLGSSIFLSSLALATDEPSADGKDAFEKEFEQVQQEMELEEKVIEPCIKAVKEEVPNGDFDAYVEDGNVKTMGSQKELSKFEKCMAKRGHPLKKVDDSRSRER